MQEGVVGAARQRQGALMNLSHERQTLPGNGSLKVDTTGVEQQVHGRATFHGLRTT